MGSPPGYRIADSVDNLGDVTGDGIDDIVCGGSWGPGYQGRVEVHSGSDGQLIHQLDGEFFFGVSVAATGDLSGDGIPDFLVGSPFADSNGYTDNGVAYLYSGDDGSLLMELSGFGNSGQFGDFVSAAGDLDRDGVNDLFVGEPARNSGHILSGVNGSLIRSMTEGIHYGQFGSFAEATDLNADGFVDFVIGAPGAYIGSHQEAGAVFTYLYDPFLHASQHTISAAQGGTIEFQIDFPDENAGMDYIVLGSISGNGPTTSAGLEIPLTADAFTALTRLAPPPFFHQTSGTLDAFGDSTATVQAGANQLIQYIGLRAWFAAVAYQNGGANLHRATADVTVDVLQ